MIGIFDIFRICLLVVLLQLFLQLAQCKSHLARFFPDTHTRSNYPNTPSPVHPGHILRSVPTVLGRNNIRNAQQRMSSTLQRFECFPLEKDAHAKFSEIYAQFLLRNLLLTKRSILLGGFHPKHISSHAEYLPHCYTIHFVLQEQALFL